MTRVAASARDRSSVQSTDIVDVALKKERDKCHARQSSGFDSCWDLVGAPVETSHGIGIVRKCVERDGDSPILVVDLGDAPVSHSRDDPSKKTGDSPSKSAAGMASGSPGCQGTRRVLHITRDKLQKKPVCAPGTCVDTKYGTGVLVGFRPKDGTHIVRLWQPRGTGSALAYLAPSALLGKLPTASGMRVVTPDGHGVVVRLIRQGSRDGGNSKAGAAATVVPTNSSRSISGSGTAEVGAEAADPAGVPLFLVEFSNDGYTALVEGEKVSTPVAKVLPLVERVADRSKCLVSKANINIGTSARGLLATVKGPAADLEGGTKATVDAANGEARGIDGVPSEEGGVPARAGDQDQRALHLAELARAEASKFEALLASGRQSLDDLIAGALSENPVDGVGLEEGLGRTRAELMRVWKEGKEQLVALADKGGKALEIDRRLASLRSLAKDSPELTKIVMELETGASKAKELQSQLEATKTVGVLMDGKTRLESGLNEVINAYRDDAGVVAAKERGGRLLKVLTEEDSPAVTKGVKLLRGAHERVVAQGGGWKSVLSGWQESGGALDGQGRLSGVLKSAAQGISNGGAGAQDVVRLLRGDPALRATDASLRLLENVLLAFTEAVPRPRPACTVLVGDGRFNEAGEECDVSGGEGNEDAWDGGWCAQDLVERFESGQLAEEVVRGMTQQASTQALSFLDRVSATNLVEGSETMASLKLLERYRGGEAGLDDAVAYALDFLNSEHGESLAGGLVSRGERGLESLKSMSREGAVGRVLERLADPGLEERIMRGIEGIDTDQLLDTAEKAMSDAETRARLLDGVKSSTVDFLLDYLPHIEVPPVSGKSSRVSYAIANLDLSGFRLKKEDVEVQVVDLSSSGKSGIAAVEGGSNSAAATICQDDGENEGARRGNDLPAGDESRSNSDAAAAAVDIAVGDDREMAAIPWASVKAADPAVKPGDVTFASLPAVTGLAPAAGEGMVGKDIQESQGGGISAEDSLANPNYGDGVDWGLMGDAGVDVSGDWDRSEGIGRQQSVGPPKVALEELEPAEVLKVVARGIGAEFKTLQWACRQEIFPYTRFAGTADAAVVDGYVSLGFAIKRGVVDPEKGVEGPLLVLSTRTVTLDRLDLKVANCRMAWLINLLTRLFASTISTYVCRALQQQLDGHASDLLGAMNGFAEGSWPFLLGLTNVKLQDLPLATETELAMARGEGRPEGVAGIVAGIAGLGYALGANTGDAVVEHRSLDEAFVVTNGLGSLKLKGFVEEDFAVVFDEDGPLGMQVDIEKGNPGRIVVSGLHPGGQAERLLGAPTGGSPAYSLVGSELLTVGGTSVKGMEGRSVFELLRSCSRPVQMTFRCYVPDVAEEIAAAAVGGDIKEPPPPEGLVTATFKQKSLGVKFRASPSLGTRVTRVGGFSRDVEGRMREAEASGLMVPGQLLYSVNGKRVLGRDFHELVRGLQKLGRPVEFGLAPNIEVHVTVDRPPLELELRRVSGRVTVTGFCEVPTALEATGAIQPGDVILSVNGIPLPGPRSYEKDAALLKAPGMFPVRLRINRPKQGTVVPEVGYGGGELADGATPSGGIWGKGMGAGLEGSLSRLKQYQSAVSTSAAEVVAETPDDLSLCVEQGKDGRPVVQSMPYVKGRLEKGGVIQPGMVLVGIGGVPVMGGHFGSVSNCRRTLGAAEYPCTLTFRDMPKYVWLSRLLSMRTPS